MKPLWKRPLLALALAAAGSLSSRSAGCSEGSGPCRPSGSSAGRTVTAAREFVPYFSLEFMRVTRCRALRKGSSSRISKRPPNSA